MEQYLPMDRPELEKHSQFTNLISRATMEQYLPMDRLELEKHSQWRVTELSLNLKENINETQFRMLSVCLSVCSLIVCPSVCLKIKKL